MQVKPPSCEAVPSTRISLCKRRSREHGHDHESQQRPGAPVVALPGVGHISGPGEDEQEAARVFYVAATRATQRLVIGVGGDGRFGVRFT